MGIKIKGTAGRPISTGDNKRTQATSNSRTGSSSRASGGASASGSDTVSITGSAAQLQELTAQVASLPVEDAQHVSDVQRSIASGNYHFEPEDAAENLLTQEREFAANEGKE